MGSQDVLPDPGQAVPRNAPVRRRSTRRVVPRSSRWRRRPARRTCLSSCSTTSARRVERVRRAMHDADRLDSHRERPEVDPLPHDGALRADAAARSCPAPTTTIWWTSVITQLPPPRRLGATRCADACAPLAQTLLLNSYSTAHFGKCHEGAGLDDRADGPLRDASPTSSSRFRYLYGFIGGRRSSCCPAIYGNSTSGAGQDRPRAITSPTT